MKSNGVTKRKLKPQICWRIERQTKHKLMPKMCPWFDGPRRNTENSAAVVVNRIKTRIVWKTECQPFSSHCLSTLIPSLLSVLSSASVEHQVCHSLSHGQAVFPKVPRSVADSWEGMNNVCEDGDRQAELRSRSLHLPNLFKRAFLSSQRSTGWNECMNRKEGDKEKGKEKQEPRVSAAYVKKKKTPRSGDVSWLKAAGGDLAAGKSNRAEGGY